MYTFITARSSVEREKYAELVVKILGIFTISKLCEINTFYLQEIIFQIIKFLCFTFFSLFENEPNPM